MGPQHQRSRVFRVELRHQVRPQQSGSPHHGDIHEKVHPDAEKKGQSRGKRIDVEPFFQCGFDIFQSIGHGKRQLQHGVGPGFHHVIPADADGIVPRHVAGTVFDDVGDNPHGRLRWINIGVSGEILL